MFYTTGVIKQKDVKLALNMLNLPGMYLVKS